MFTQYSNFLQLQINWTCCHQSQERLPLPGQRSHLSRRSWCRSTVCFCPSTATLFVPMDSQGTTAHLFPARSATSSNAQLRRPHRPGPTNLPSFTVLHPHKHNDDNTKTISSSFSISIDLVRTIASPSTTTKQT